MTVPAFNINPRADPKTIFIKIENHRFETDFRKTRKNILDCTKISFELKANKGNM